MQRRVGQPVISDGLLHFLRKLLLIRQVLGWSSIPYVFANMYWRRRKNTLILNWIWYDNPYCRMFIFAFAFLQFSVSLEAKMGCGKLSSRSVMNSHALAMARSILMVSIPFNTIFLRSLLQRYCTSWQTALWYLTPGPSVTLLFVFDGIMRLFY